MEFALLIASAIVVWLFSCVFWPYTACGACGGSKRLSPTKKNWGDCRHCGGTGKKIRLGRRLLGATEDL